MRFFISVAIAVICMTSSCQGEAVFSGTQECDDIGQVSASKDDCTAPFELIGNRCLMIDTVVLGTWGEMRLFCEQLGGQMLKLNSCYLMEQIVNYVQDNGLTQLSYWIGMTDKENEGEFVHLDGTIAPMGTPFWYVDQPDGGTDENCVFMAMDKKYYLVDGPCNGVVYSTICEQ